MASSSWLNFALSAMLKKGHSKLLDTPSHHTDRMTFRVEISNSFALHSTATLDHLAIYLAC